MQLILYPAQVQGEGATESIVRGIHALEHYGVDRDDRGTRRRIYRGSVGV